MKWMKTMSLCVWSLGVSLVAKDWRQDFDERPFSTAVPRQRAVQVVDAIESSLGEGVRGRCLDLRSSIPKRVALRCGTEPIAYGDAFSVSLWVKTDVGANPAGVLATNGEESTYGWQIDALESGTWKIRLTDGKSTLDYAPPKQRINDGQWHQLAVSVDRKENHARFYFDGRPVAIYHLAGLKALRKGGQTCFGGVGWGMTHTFNGCLDQLRVTDRALTSGEIRGEFEEMQPARRLVVPELKGRKIRCMTWNIWQGGRVTGNHVGPQHVIDVIKQINPDVVGIIETYGSGAILADGLGYQLYLISSNLSILSRYPIEQVIPVFRPFNSGAAKIRFGKGKSILFTEAWLHYLPDFLLQLSQKKMTNEALYNGEKATRLNEIKEILKVLKPYMKDAETTPVLVCGDFNVASHLDWTKENRDLHRGYWVDWPVSRTMEEAGFMDTYRTLHPDVRAFRAPSWCVWDLRPEGTYGQYLLQTRIDFIYLLGGKAAACDYVETSKPFQFPSDHGLFYADIILP